MLKLVNVANPAAGADWSTTVPANEWWRIKSLGFVYVTDGTGSSRAPKLTIDDGQATHIIASISIQTGQNISVTCQYCAFPGGAAEASLAASGTQKQLGLPDTVLPPGYRIRTVTGGIGAADQYSNIYLLVDFDYAEMGLNRKGAS